jgi:SAM-dependent methyltransferase
MVIPTPVRFEEREPSMFYLPDEFDVLFYRTYDDLCELTDEQLRNHYHKYGSIEGRLGTHWAFRENFVNLVPDGLQILEIGPFCNPSFRGRNVRYFDVLDKEHLIQRAVQFGIPFTDAPQIHYVSAVGDLEIIPETFDVVFSSHCVEHQPDLVLHLNQVANILRDKGCYFLIVPDKRFCFDHFRCESTVAAVIGAHIEHRITNTAKSSLEHRLLMTHNDPFRHWNGDHGEPAWRALGKEFIDQTCVEVTEAHASHIETHAWHFTPESFRNVIETLWEFGLVQMRQIRVYPTPYGRFEFCAVLEKKDRS